MTEMTHERMKEIGAQMRVYRAAPDLLAICKATRVYFEHKRDEYDWGVGVPGAYMAALEPEARDLWAQLDAAIAEAEGGE